MSLDKGAKLLIEDMEMVNSGQREKARVLFVMSKQTVINDSEETGQRKYKRMVFVEFLEFLVRLAQLKFMETELENIEVAEKLVHVLD